MIKQNKKNNLISFGFFVIVIVFIINPAFAMFGVPLIIITIAFLVVHERIKRPSLSDNFKEVNEDDVETIVNQDNLNDLDQEMTPETEFDVIDSAESLSFTNAQTKLERRKKYLHIALNNSLAEAQNIISQLPSSDRILIEVGTPMIKNYGIEAIEEIKRLAPTGAYIVADNKCTDLASREVEMMAEAGANAATCLGVAPIETINNFITECENFGLDSMIDMMNVEDSLSVLKKLKKLPTVVILHRGVDETEITKGKQIPFYQIKQIKGNYNLIVAVAGGDTIKEIQSALFNGADIVVVWKNFYQADSDTAKLANDFLKEVQ